jgi:hypothetical protein
MGGNQTGTVLLDDLFDLCNHRLISYSSLQTDPMGLNQQLEKISGIAWIRTNITHTIQKDLLRDKRAHFQSDTSPSITEVYYS